jgi:hypothetical protein
MKKILISVAIVVGLLATVEVGLLFFPWSYSPHLVSRPLTLAEKNQRRWERFASVPLWETEAAQARNTERDVLIDKVGELEARITRLERQVASQNFTISRLSSTSSFPSYELQRLESKIDESLMAAT